MSGPLKAARHAVFCWSVKDRNCAESRSKASCRLPPESRCRANWKARSNIASFATGSVLAARVWWMLRWIGFDRAALLDGGLDAWTAAGRPLSTEPASRPAGSLTVNLRPELIADRDEVLASIENEAPAPVRQTATPREEEP